MIALLRYAFVKSWREHLLSGLILAPFVLLFVPVIGIAVEDMISKTGNYPRPPRLSAAAFSSGLTWGSMVLATISAATGGFWIFRREIATREIGVFILATRAWTIALAATAFGALVSISVFLVSIGAVRIITGQFPPHIVRTGLFAIFACIALSALGAALVSLSPDVNMMVPLYAITLGVAIYAVESKQVFLASLLAAAAFLVGTSAVLMRRRCAT